VRRGEIWLANLEPVQGAEANRWRPVVIASNDRANARAAQLGRGVVTIVPVTSNVTRVLPFQVLLPADRTGLRLDSKAQAEQVRSVDVTRLSVRIAQVPPSLVNELDEALRLHLDL